MNDEFAKSLGRFEDLERLKMQIKDNLRKEAGFKEKEKIEGEILEKVAQDSQIELLDILVESELDKMIEGYKNRTELQGLRFEDYLNQIGRNVEEIKKGYSQITIFIFKQSTISNQQYPIFNFVNHAY